MVKYKMYGKCWIWYGNESVSWPRMEPGARSIAGAAAKTVDLLGASVPLAGAGGFGDVHADRCLCCWPGPVGAVLGDHLCDRSSPAANLFTPDSVGHSSESSDLPPVISTENSEHHSCWHRLLTCLPSR